MTVIEGSGFVNSSERETHRQTDAIQGSQKVIHKAVQELLT